jgi:cellulose synthase (UDP-forming)
VRLQHSRGTVHGRLRAVSATGAELGLESTEDASVLQAADTLSLEGLVPGMAVPFLAMAQEGGAIGGVWGPLTPPQRDQLETMLYRREGLWPTLRAPFELRTLPLVLLRTLQRVEPERWFRRSLIPQLPPLEGLPLPRHADLPARAGAPDPAR